MEAAHHTDTSEDEWPKSSGILSFLVDILVFYMDDSSFSSWDINIPPLSRPSHDRSFINTPTHTHTEFSRHLLSPHTDVGRSHIQTPPESSMKMLWVQCRLESSSREEAVLTPKLLLLVALDAELWDSLDELWRRRTTVRDHTSSYAASSSVLHVNLLICASSMEVMFSLPFCFSARLLTNYFHEIWPKEEPITFSSTSE